MNLKQRDKTREKFKQDVVHGLSLSNKQIPPKYFYDQKGSKLFEQICELNEYYVTRTELGIMKEKLKEIIACLGEQCLLIEYGSGSSRKTRLILDKMEQPAGYVPIDISKEHLLEIAGELDVYYPMLKVFPVVADFTHNFTLPKFGVDYKKKAVYFPGSTIGNFSPETAEGILKTISGICGSGGSLLIGVDLKKNKSILEAAYNDAEGVTSAFNLNLLRRINRELGADFDLTQFEHKAVYNEAAGRIEMHLVSLADHQVQFAGQTFYFKKDETICTEHSYKYTIEEFEELAERASFRLEKVWTDKKNYFSLHYLTRK